MNNLKAERTLTAEEQAGNANKRVSDQILAEMLDGLKGLSSIKPGPWSTDTSVTNVVYGKDNWPLARINSNEAPSLTQHIARCDPDTIRSILAELQSLRSQSLSTQQPMGEVRVKALEWVEGTFPREDGTLEPTGEYVAETPFGSYYIDMYFGTDSYGWSANFEASDIEGSDSDSPEKAKAAQADYESGIRSALHPNQESGE